METVSLKRDFVNHALDSEVIASLMVQKSFAEKWRALDPDSSTTVKVLPCIEDAFEYVRTLDSGKGEKNGEGDDEEVHALITGSVHLVGRALGVLEGVDAL